MSTPANHRNYDEAMLKAFMRERGLKREERPCVCRLYRKRCVCVIYRWCSNLLDHAEMFSRAGRVVLVAAHRYDRDRRQLTSEERFDLDNIVAAAAGKGVQLIARLGDSSESWYFPKRSSLIEIWRADALVDMERAA